jgi:hypothetical protein
MVIDIPTHNPQIIEYVEEHKQDQIFLEKVNESIETQMIINNIKQGFDEVELHLQGKLEFKDADDYLKELANES